MLARNLSSLLAVLRDEEHFLPGLTIATQQVQALRDEVDALDDPYYQARVLIEKYGWRYGPPLPQPAAPATSR